MFDRLGRAFTFTAVMLLNVAIAIAVAEWGAGLWLKRLKAQQPIYMLNYSDAEIGALYNTSEPARYRDVIAEGWRMGDTVYSPFVEYRMTPYRGSAFNITEDGYRPNRLSEQDLKRPGPKVFVFGGSTTMGSGVRDDETIPAGIERRLRAAGRTDVQVFNFGVVSYFSTQEMIALQRLLTAGVKPDVAVFVDGLNDFYYCTVPDQSSWYERLVQLTRARARMPLGLELANRSNVVQLARALGGDKSVTVREWGSFCRGEDDVRRVVHRLDTNRRMIDAMAERLGFQAILVQQPVPTYSYDNAKRPVPVKDEMLSYHVNSKAGYPLMAAMRAEGKLWTRNLLWLAELEPQANLNAYVDTVHYSPAFNDQIGARIADEILQRGLQR
ncbi:MAG: SGNH/GDSL hydrolase family protein [Bacteroidales bacterium]